MSLKSRAALIGFAGEHQPTILARRVMESQTVIQMFNRNHTAQLSAFLPDY
jgi:hypothetical protein